MPGAELPSGTYDAGTTPAPRSQLSNVGPYRLGSKFSRKNYPRGGFTSLVPTPRPRSQVPHTTSLGRAASGTLPLVGG
jgi:hypothetical protein